MLKAKSTETRTMIIAPEAVIRAAQIHSGTVFLFIAEERAAPDWALGTDPGTGLGAMSSNYAFSTTATLGAK